MEKLERETDLNCPCNCRVVFSENSNGIEFCHQKNDQIRDVYNEVFCKHFKDFEPLRIIELGINRGGSLALFANAFKKSNIVGVDINHGTICSQAKLHFENHKDRIQIVQTDQADKELLKYGPFDLIIDDGSHRNEDMKASFNLLWPELKSGGFYVIEDWCVLHNTDDFFYNEIIRTISNSPYDNNSPSYAPKNVIIYRNVMFFQKK